MNIKSKVKSILIFVYSIFLFSCNSYDAEINEVLQLSGSNKSELIKVLNHFKDDTLKFKAACFLIKNMKYHQSDEKIISVDPQIPEIFHKIDSIFHGVSGGLKVDELTTQEVRRVFTLKERITKNFLKIYTSETQIISGEFKDIEEIKASYLISHIENAFKVKEESRFAKNLSFEDFCEYILPYRSTSLPIYFNGAEINQMFFHHFMSYPNADIKMLLKFYNIYVSRFKYLAGKFPIQTNLSVYNPFFGIRQDCIGTSSNGVDILRACGIPATLDYNAAYKEYISRHFHCAVLHTNADWLFFNPESRILEKSDFQSSTNMFRTMFSLQEDNPYSLKANDEFVPEFFNNPCLKEVTTLYKEVHNVTLPIGFDTDNRLAYLYTFLRNNEGFTPATWGIIDHNNKEINFSNVIANILYFPVYLNDDEEIFFSSPFWVDNFSNFHSIDEYLTNQNEKGEITLLRKFPQKKTMLNKAGNIVGGKFIASNSKDFKKFTVLHEIKEVPVPYLQEVKIHSPKTYHYYRFVASESSNESNISHLEFIVDNDPSNEMIIPATPLPVFKENQQKEQPAYQVINESLSEFLKKSWFDGNFTTSSGSKKNIDFFLEKPYKVKYIRFAPLNADNGIKRDDIYELRYWDNGWRRVGETAEASYEYITFKDVPLGKFYWLRNLTSGKEELPFILENGIQKFIYYDFIK